MYIQSRPVLIIHKFKYRIGSVAVQPVLVTVSTEELLTSADVAKSFNEDPPCITIAGVLRDFEATILLAFRVGLVDGASVAGIDQVGTLVYPVRRNRGGDLLSHGIFGVIFRAIRRKLRGTKDLRSRSKGWGKVTAYGAINIKVRPGKAPKLARYVD
jgi:hypothetical protein